MNTLPRTQEEFADQLDASAERLLIESRNAPTMDIAIMKDRWALQYRRLAKNIRCKR